MRAGRSVVDALNSLADRLSLEEAASFVAVLRHSVELGADVSESLRVFSDEMRDKRILRAEEVANMVPAKIVLPLTLGIFPVIMTIMIVPPALRLMSAFKWG
jgi:tight adherence protein C